MNILFITHHFQTPDQPGAPRPWQVAKFLKERGHTVTVITAGVHYMTGEVSDNMKGKLWIRRNIDGLTIIKTSALSNYRISLRKRMISYLLFSLCAFWAGLNSKQLDVVLVGSTPFSVIASGYVLSKIKRARFIIEERELFPEEIVELGYVKSRFLIRLLLAYQQFFRKRADKIIALTPAIKEILVDKGIDENKITVITNAYDKETYFNNEDHDDKNIRANLGWNSKFIVLYTGTFGQVNELFTLVKAAQLLKSYKNILFIMIGEGERKKEYENFCKNEDLSNCHFLPARKKKEMSLFYKNADVCVQLVPRGRFWRCVLSNKIFDYLGSGRPVVFGGDGDTADLLGQANAGVVVDPENPDALAKAIISLYNNPEKRKIMGQNGRDYILRHYTREKLLKELEDVILRT